MKTTVWFVEVAVLILFLSYKLEGISLRVVPATKTTHQTKVAANFPFDPPIEVEILDGSGNRITTGSDSSLVVTPVFPNKTICLSVDSTFQLANGHGVFKGSICEVVSTPVTISFDVTASSGALRSDASNPFEVTGDIHLALFSKNKRFHSGRFEAFMRHAIDDVNSGQFRYPMRQVFTDRTIKLKSYYYGDRPHSYIQSFQEMVKFHEGNPDKKAHGIIGFSDNDVSKILLPLAMQRKYAVTSYREDTLADFSDKTRYPYFNRIHYANDIIDYGLLIFMKERKWNKILIVKRNIDKFTPEFYDYAKRLGIEIVKEFSVNDIQDYTNEPEGKHASLFTKIKETGIRIILSSVTGPACTYLHTEAILNNVTSTDGFQWIGYQNQADFPDSNSPAGCHKDASSLCNMRFKGMVFNEPLVTVDGWETPEWNMLWLKHYDKDEFKVVGAHIEFPQYDIAGLGALYGLTYDVIIVKVNALESLIKQNKTVNGETLSAEIRTNTNLHATTGNLQLNPATGDRDNYLARSTVLWPNMEYFIAEFQSKIDLGLMQWWDWTPASKYVTNTVYVVSNTNSTSVVEHKTRGGKKAFGIFASYSDFDCLTGYVQIDAKYKNNRSFTAYKGLFNFDRQMQVAHNLNPFVEDVLIGLETETKYELVPASFYCSAGCGGHKTDPTDINKFDNGVCIAQDTCQCFVDGNGNPMWSGSSCELAVCSAGCVMGTCVSPENCVCLQGWEGVDCNTAKCSSCSAAGGTCVSPEVCVCNPGQFGPSCGGKCTCKNGECNGGLTGDGYCSKCDSGYIGSNCDISLVGLCVPTIIGSILLIVGLYFAAQFFVKRAQLRAALLNNDWIVDWNDFKVHDAATGRSSMFLSALSMNRNHQQKKQINTGNWEGIDVHYQKLNKDTVVLTDAVRLEVKQMRDMRHVNIVTFVGCSIVAPNVCILTELQPKGSLDDILSNEDIKLPWNFRFALLKGIMKGLTFIHDSQIKSHGRLKSSNCLIDNRWTVKLTGFGLQGFKYGQKNCGEFNLHNPVIDPDPEVSNYGSLIWTAPEILQAGVYHIDHVGRGTVEGDIYSFGMVITEMCTRDIPFAELMLEKKEIIDLICGKKDESILKVWNDYIAKLNIEQGGLIRPCIKDKEWPSKYEKRKALKKLMENCWNDDPVHRPSTKEVQETLERIEPQRGELMDHLVSMLEKYSSNLEDVVAKRTKQLAKEKQKTEDLVSRLLPKSVAEELKQGRRVAPENFDAVTIYFSDIVGFTSIAKASTPLEVVALLNDMYTVFDSISANYDVYKVETIGDAYMIVSGLPTRNGDTHAGEIATTAMDLMSAIGGFKIAHMPDTKLRLRAGIHTGNVVAGVVGLKMPRYCLFGESVNVAAKMESGGSPLRIQVSEDTYEVLRRLGGYKCEFRHEMDIKGRGMVKTYWLTGKTGYDKVLPKPE